MPTVTKGNKPNNVTVSTEKPIVDGGVYVYVKASEDSPLTTYLFAIPGVKRILFFRDKISVEFDQEQEGMLAAVEEAMEKFLASGKSALETQEVKETTEELSEEEQADREGQLKALLDTEINPFVAAHGGKIVLEKIKGNDVYLQLTGGCQGCPSANATLKMGVEARMRELFPWLGKVIDATDHRAGKEPDAE